MNSKLSPLANKGYDPAYRRNQIRSTGFLAGLFFLLVVAFLLSLRAGSYNTPLSQLIRGVFGKAADEKINLVVRNNRLPRICTAIVSGAGLGVTGCVFQAVLRNPLASASTLGVSQGASFGAAFAIIVLNLGAVGGLGGMAIPLCAFVGSMAVALVILGLSRFRQVSAEGIVLAGRHCVGNLWGQFPIGPPDPGPPVPPACPAH